MGRYSAQFRNQVLKKLLPPENRSASSLAREYNLSVATIYGWKAKMKQGTLGEEEGVVGNKSRPLEEKLTLLLESGRIPEERRGMLSPNFWTQNGLVFMNSPLPI